MRRNQDRRKVSANAPPVIGISDEVNALRSSLRKRDGSTPRPPCRWMQRAPRHHPSCPAALRGRVGTEG